MKKTTGKVLSFVLSLALVLTSFPAMLASASTHHTVSGTLDFGSAEDHDNEICLVSGSKFDAQQKVTNFEDWIGGTPTLKSDTHKEASDVKIAAISHKSGDRIVKWEDGSDEGSIDDDTTSITLKLRSNSVDGHEVLNVLYKGTYTDDDDNEYTVKASKTVDVYAYQMHDYVIGVYGDEEEGKNVELDDDFAQKTLAHEENSNTGATDSKDLTVFEAMPSTDSAKVSWVARKTKVKDNNLDLTKEANADKADGTYYTLDSSSGNVTLDDGSVTEKTGTKDAAIAAPGLDLKAPSTGYTVNKALSDDSALTYYYTTDGTVPEWYTDTITGTDAHAAGDPKNTATHKTTDKLTVADDSKTITIVGVNSITFKQATNVVKGTYTYDSDTETNSKITSEVTSAGLGTPVPAVDTDGVTVKPTAPLNGDSALYYYVKVGNNDWKPVAYTDLGSAKTTDYAVSAAQSITVKAFVSTTQKTTADDIATLANSSTVASATYTAKAEETGAGNYVTATVKDNAGTGSVTFTAKPTYWALNNDATENTDDVDKVADVKDNGRPNDDDDVKVKVKVEKKILVTHDDIADGFNKIGKYSGTTYIYKTSLSGENVKADTKDTDAEGNKITKRTAVKVNGYEVNFADDCDVDTVSVDDKASVTKVTGKLGTLKIASGTVSDIDVDQLETLTVDDAKAGNVTIGDDGKTATIKVSSKGSIGDIDIDDDVETSKVTVESGKTGNITAKTVDVKADEDDYVTTIGDITANTVTFDAEDSKISTGTLKANDSGAEFEFDSDNVDVKAIDFDNYDADLKFDDYQGKIPAPKNATEDGSSISTTNGDDRVEVTGDCDVNTVSIEDDSQITFDGKLNVTSVDGSGILAIGAGKMYIDGDVSSTTLKLTDASIAKGTTAFTSLTDTVDAGDFDCYGFTLEKKTGSKTDTFTVASVVFKGLTVNKTSSEVAKGYSETFTAYAYPGGTTMPTGYTVKWALKDADDSIFDLTTNANGTATVKVVGYDKDFASNDKATLTATLVDPDGEECDSDEYAVGECALTALEVPKVTCTSDTNANFSLAQGASYQFKITSTDGSEPTFGVGSGSLAVSKVGKSGNAYFYKVTAVGKVGDQVGVYLNKARLLVVTISASSVQLDTGAKLSVAKGKTYQFKATSTAAVKATTGNGAVFQIVKVSKAGNNTFVTVKAVGTKGQSTGIYFNGVRRTVATVA